MGERILLTRFKAREACELCEDGIGLFQDIKEELEQADFREDDPMFVYLESIIQSANRLYVNLLRQKMGKDAVRI